MVELKACPFCGSSDAHLARGDKYHWGVCFQCRAEGPVIDTEELAATLWNTRASPWQELPATPTPGVAPWDGRPVLLCYAPLGHVPDAYWADWWRQNGRDTTGWHHAVDEPTHWRQLDAPLPSPPVREGG